MKATAECNFSQEIMSIKLKEKNNSNFCLFFFFPLLFDSTTFMFHCVSFYVYTCTFRCKWLSLGNLKVHTKSSATKNKPEFYLSVSSWSYKYIRIECQIIYLEIKNIYQPEAVDHFCRQSQHNFCLASDNGEQLLAT